MTTNYNIAGFHLRLTEERFLFRGLAAFATTQTDTPHLELRYGICRTDTHSAVLLDTFDFPDAQAVCRLYRIPAGYLLAMTTPTGSVHFEVGDDKPIVLTDFTDGQHPALLRFGLWETFNIRAAATGIEAIHSSVVVHNGGAVLCLGESGTGKSTHTRLWLNHIDGTHLLNDDSPMVGMRNGQATVFGSPWSGKTPCYRNESYPIRAFVRLSQAKENRIEKLSVLRAYGALLPSFPPSFTHDEQLSAATDALLSQLLSNVPVYHLACLPDAAAAELACHTLYETK